jgi:hypothetical protein
MWRFGRSGFVPMVCVVIGRPTRCPLYVSFRSVEFADSAVACTIWLLMSSGVAELVKIVF